MLILTRREGECIVINGQIRILVAELEKGHVKLGMTAPADVRIDRLEVHERRLNSSVPVPSLAAATEDS